MEISQARAREAYEKFQSMKTRMRSLREANEKVIGETLMAVEVLGGCAAAGYLNAKQGSGGKPWQLFGFDADMVIGLACTGAALMGLGGKYDEHLLGVGLGFGSSWSNREGAAMAAASTTTTTTTQTAGALPASQFVGALPASQFVGALDAAGNWHTQNAGAIPAGQYAGAKTHDGTFLTATQLKAMGH